MAALPPSARDALEPLRADLASLALLLDIDGTLAPIAPRPGEARLLEGVADVLTELRGRVGLLAFVSGRRVADARRMVGLDGVHFAGNHGLEVLAPGGSIELAPGVEEHLAAIEDFVADWGEAALAERGIRVEPKGATVSFHSRGAPDPAAAARALELIAAEARERGLRPTSGREVVEVRPPIAIDKGSAVRALLDGSGLRSALYVGDDRTDADAWRALRALVAEGALERSLGIAVLSREVPAEVREAADLEVEGPEAVLAVLRHLASGPS